MRPTWWLVFVLVTPVLSGCIGNGDGSEDDTGSTFDESLLSQVRFDVLDVEELWVASSVDGRGMHNAVYRPDTDEQVPVIINFSPYWGDSAEAGGDNFASYLIEHYVPRGYAVVLSAVRGTGHSEGCFQIAGDLELQDTYDVVDHFANVEWSNGKVAAGGKSYDSTTQNGMIAKVPHPALETIFHVSGITDFYRYQYREGLPYFHGPLFNYYYHFGQGLDEYGIDVFPPTAAPDRLSEEDPDSLMRVIDDAACTEMPSMQLSGVGSGVHGLKDDYWIERDWNRYIADSSTDTSIFFVHGLQDWNVKPDHILPWLERLPDEVVVKGWLHQWTREPEGGHVYPMRADWNTTMLRWFDHFLKDVGTGILDEPAFEVQSSDGQWRVSAAWPPTNAVPTPFALTEPTEETTSMGLSAYAATIVEATDAPLRYAGMPRLTITATATGSDPALIAILYDVDPSGERTWVNEGVLRAIYRNGLEAPEPVPPETPIEYAVSFYPQDDVLEPGHSWVLVVGGDARFVLTTPAQMGAIEYELGSGELTLPMAPIGDLRPVHPESIDCFAC